FAAGLAGMNLLVGELGDGGTSAVSGELVLHGLADAGAPLGAPGSAVAATFSPRAVSVHTEPPGGSPRNVVAAHVEILEHQGELVRVRARVPAGPVLAADITPAAVVALGLEPGMDVTLA